MDNQKVYILKLSFPDFSRDNVLRAARTLSQKPVILNGRRLRFPLNQVYWAEYDERTGEIQVILLSIEKEIQEIYEKNRTIYATASVSENPPCVLPHLLNFAELVLSTTPTKSWYETSLNMIPDLETAIRRVL
jgi:hypothetical protein